MTENDHCSAEVHLESIRAAQKRIDPYVIRTPLLYSETLSAQTGVKLYFKCENLQHVGAFKARGATNAVFCLPAERLQAGVVTHSSGNHGAAVSRAAQLRGTRAWIVMPENSSNAKFEAVHRYGGEVVRCAPTIAAREAAAAAIQTERGASFVHPYDDPRVIAGQGTVALELLEQQPELDWILCPVGGGGLLSGVSCAAKSLRPAVRVMGVEPAGADDAFRSFHSGQLAPPPQASTIADGLRGALSARTFALIRRYVDGVVTVSEASIVRAMRELWQQLRVVVEASAAVPYAALLEGAVDLRGARVGIILTGGNVDLDALPWIATGR